MYFKMHGKPRKPLKQEDESVLSAKAEKLRALQSQFFANHRDHIYTQEALDLSAKLLEINPECYTAWNYRKLAVQHNLSRSDPDYVAFLFHQELKLVENALNKNYKSYGAWYHRKWVLSKGHSSIDDELRLLNGFQKADPRNFHAWNYRRFVTSLMKRSDEDELIYTKEVIEEDFRNYSAWHNRSVLLSNLFKRKAKGFRLKKKVLQEYKHVRSAYFTDPEVQSGWFYYLWLIDLTVRNYAPLLVSSWPSHGSTMTLNGNNCIDGCGLSLLNSTLSDTRALPVILYFNQAVEGVNLSTVAVKSELLKEDLVWKPLLTNNSSTAQAWGAYLNLGNLELEQSKTYSIEITIGHPMGIVSSNGYQYGDPPQIAFKLCVQTASTKPVEEQGGKLTSWKENNFQRIDHFEDLDSIVSADLHIPTTPYWCKKAIRYDIKHFRKLLSIDECKFGKLSLARLLATRDLLTHQHDKRKNHTEEVLKLYTDLMELDPTHSQYYKDELSLVLLRRITSTRESLLPYCYYYKDATEVNTSCVCLRLQNLSLSRMGSIANLLWVQMLDLSHNELCSIEGLEAMQLLSSLNLSHNKFGSFIGLGPLRLLRSLKVLDISYNEIGSHLIDTKRYLCSSPFANTEVFAWDRFEILCGSFSATKFWEAFLIFESLNLTDLNVTGNAVADENFTSFIVKVLPTLKWLNSEELS